MTMPRDVPTSISPEASSSSPGASSSEQPTEGGARAQIRDVKNQVLDEAKTSLRRARDSAASSLTDGRSRAADSLRTVAGAVRSTGERLRAENRPAAANLTDSLADQVEGISSYLRDRDLRAVREDVESFARRQPAVAIGVALALGVLGARFIKSSQRTAGTSFRRESDEDAEVESFGGYGAGATLGSETAGGGYAGA